MNLNTESELKRLINEYEDDEICVSSSKRANSNPFDDKIVNLIQHQIENGLTMRCTTKTAKLLNSMSSCDVTIPESEKSIKSKMKVSLSPQCYVICQCESLVKDGEKCAGCGIHAKKDA